MKTILTIKTISNNTFKVKGDDYNFDTKERIHYLDGQSFPNSIVQKKEETDV